MKHSVIYKNENRYAGFPLLYQNDEGFPILGFFVAPKPDHCGVHNWEVMASTDEGESWNKVYNTPYDWPAASSREKSDRFTSKLFTNLGETTLQIATGSVGFDTNNKEGKLSKSPGLFHRHTYNNWKNISQRYYLVPSVDSIFTFPRHLQIDNLVLVPAYGILKTQGGDISRCFVWCSTNHGLSFRLYNMFPDGVEGNEMAFIETKNGILAHIRSDHHPWLMESWSEDRGKTWSYPTNVYTQLEGRNFKDVYVTGGPPHLLRLRDGRILCSYGYRFEPMGIRAVISDDEGSTWSKPIILREDGGYSSGLRKEKIDFTQLWKHGYFKFGGWFWKKPELNPGEDVGYPVSIQLKDDSVLTVYYITCEDGVTHIAGTKWEPTLLSDEYNAMMEELKE